MVSRGALQRESDSVRTGSPFAFCTTRDSYRPSSLFATVVVSYQPFCCASGLGPSPDLGPKRLTSHRMGEIRTGEAIVS